MKKTDLTIAIAAADHLSDAFDVELEIVFGFDVVNENKIERLVCHNCLAGNRVISTDFRG